VSDAGKGIPREKQDTLNSPGSVGVGLRGMRERVSQLRGVLRVQSTESGTTVEAILPVRHAEVMALEGNSHTAVV
jgi:two-component system, NarL family, sensor kinase